MVNRLYTERTMATGYKICDPLVAQDNNYVYFNEMSYKIIFFVFWDFYLFKLIFRHLKPHESWINDIDITVECDTL